MGLEVKNLVYRYPGGGAPVLKGASLSLAGGERLGLLGESGRGKTTLCLLLGGYLAPQSGEILLDGRPLADYKGCCPVQLVWQHPQEAVNPRLPMRAVLEEGDRVEPRVIQGLGIEPAWLERYPGELSGGELQRFSLARALGRSTRFLLCDEISAMLDLVTQAQIWSFLLEETARRGIGLLAVSHSPPLLERICSRVQRVDALCGPAGLIN